MTFVCLLKPLKQSKKAENDVSSILLKFPVWCPPVAITCITHQPLITTAGTDVLATGQQLTRVMPCS